MAFSQGHILVVVVTLEPLGVPTLVDISCGAHGRDTAVATVGRKAMVSDSKIATMVRRNFIDVDFLSSLKASF